MAGATIGAQNVLYRVHRERHRTVQLRALRGGRRRRLRGGRRGRRCRPRGGGCRWRCRAGDVDRGRCRVGRFIAVRSAAAAEHAREQRQPCGPPRAKPSELAHHSILQRIRSGRHPLSSRPVREVQKTRTTRLSRRRPLEVAAASGDRAIAAFAAPPGWLPGRESARYWKIQRSSAVASLSPGAHAPPPRADSAALRAQLRIEHALVTMSTPWSR
jgi:hypothetical protein